MSAPRCHCAVIGGDLETVQRFIAGLMREEDLVAEQPLTLYSRLLTTSQRPLAVNLWYLGDLSTDIEEHIALRHINLWLFLINEENSNGSQELDALWKRWRELLIIIGREQQPGAVAIIAAHQERSVVTNHIRDDCLQWCLKHKDLPLLEVDLSSDYYATERQTALGCSPEWLTLLWSCQDE